MAHPELQILMNSSDPADREWFDRLMADPDVQALMNSDSAEGRAMFESRMEELRFVNDEEEGGEDHG